MSTPDATDDAVRELLLVMPRLIGRIKRLPVPDELRSLDLAPRHLSMLSLLLLAGAAPLRRRRNGGSPAA